MLWITISDVCITQIKLDFNEHLKIKTLVLTGTFWVVLIEIHCKIMRNLRTERETQHQKICDTVKPSALIFEITHIWDTQPVSFRFTYFKVGMMIIEPARCTERTNTFFHLYLKSFQSMKRITACIKHGTSPWLVLESNKTHFQSHIQPRPDLWLEHCNQSDDLWLA